MTGIVLAGGKSTRFGSEKARVLWRGKQLVDHVVELLRPLTDEIVLVVRADQTGESWPGDRIVSDDPDLPPGPLRGLVAGLSAGRSEWAWVVGCDTPCLQPTLLRAMREAAGPEKSAVVPIHEGVKQPLIACYRCEVASRLRDLCRAGERSPLRALAKIPHHALSQSEIEVHDPRGLSFCNLNSPEDLAALTADLDG